MADNKNNIAERVYELAAPIAEGLGLRIWDVFYGKEGQSRILRVTIDKDGGIFIDDCEALSRALDPVLDEADIIPDAYGFEVSSPGIGRKISTDAQFAAYIGKSVLVRLIRPDEKGNRDYAGTLESFDADTFTISAESGTDTFKRNAAAYVKADDDIDF